MMNLTIVLKNIAKFAIKGLKKLQQQLMKKMLI